jgi:PAS domain-containing protein
MPDFLVLSDADADDVVVRCRRASRGPGVCLACLRADGRLELLSGAWESMLGFPPGGLDGRSLYSLLGIERHSARAALRRLLDHAQPDPVALLMRGGDGMMRTLHVHRLFDEYEPSLYLACEPVKAPEISRAIAATSSLSSA